MRLRHRLIVGLGMTLAATSLVIANANAQAPGQPSRAQPSRAPMPAPNMAAVAAPPAAPSPASFGATRIRTLNEALAASYANNPALQQERARLRATDESVPQALAGWRPQVSMSGQAGYGDGYSRQWLAGGTTTLADGTVVPVPGRNSDSRTNRTIGIASGVVSQPVYTGGKVRANLNKADNAVMAERARLIVSEQTAMTDTVNAYVNLIQAQQTLGLRINNEQVLARQLQATNDRFRVGEITRTDVAQAEAALAGATADRERALGDLQIARSLFQKAVGVLPPPDLVEPQPLNLPLKNQNEAAVMARTNNPNVVAAQFDNAAAKDNVDVQFAALMPTVSLQGQIFQQANASTAHNNTNGYQVGAVVSVPLYQGGNEYATVRQARQQQQATSRAVDDAKRTAQQAAVQAWETLASNRAQADSTKVQIRANQIALEGVQREAIVGSRTTLDVLNAQQTLLQSQLLLVQNLASVVYQSYVVASAVGRLTAKDLNLPVAFYDETAYYNAVRNKWIGTGDQATDQPGR
jgi:outer membrane protein